MLHHNNDYHHHFIFIDCSRQPAFVQYGYLAHNAQGEYPFTYHKQLKPTDKTETLLLEIKALSEQYSMNIASSPPSVFVNKGPGIFTGLRIGIALAKGLSLGWNAPLIGLDHFQLMQLNIIMHNSEIQDDAILLITSAKGGRFYTQLFMQEKQQLLAQPQELSFEEIILFQQENPNAAFMTNDKIAYDALKHNDILSTKLIYHDYVQESASHLLHFLKMGASFQNRLKSLTPEAVYIREANAALPHPLLQMQMR